MSVLGHEIIAELHDEDVVDFHKVTIQRNDETIWAYTNTCILTFNRLQLPEILKIG